MPSNGDRDKDADTQAGSTTGKARTTWSGCACLQSWRDSVNNFRCETYCCNPDGEPGGDWCKVADTACQKGDWGYCPPLEKAANCIDYPSDWEDEEHDNCGAYASYGYCDGQGGYGPKWNFEWGTFQDYENNGFTPTAACCSCGGGLRPTWTVLIGTCRIDDEGCLTSPNYPSTYNKDDRCEIQVRANNDKHIHVVSFATELYYDKLTVNGKSYSGTSGPEGVTPHGTIIWESDDEDPSAGWKLCAEAAKEKAWDTGGQAYLPEKTWDAEQSRSNPSPAPAPAPALKVAESSGARSGLQAWERHSL